MRMKLVGGPQEQQLLALRNRKIDAMVMDLQSIPHASSDLYVQELVELQNGIICSARHPLAKKKNLAFSDLLEYPIACTGMSLVAARQVVERFGLAAHPDTLVSLESEDVKGLLQTVCDSHAIYVGIVKTAQALMNQGQLVLLPLPTDGLGSRIAWVQRATRAPNPVMDEVLALIRTKLG